MVRGDSRRYGVGVQVRCRLNPTDSTRIGLFFLLDICATTARIRAESIRAHRREGDRMRELRLPADDVVLLLAGVVFVGIDGGARLAGAQEPGGDDLEVVAVRPDFYMIAGAGGNIAAQIGPIGVILVDTGSAAMSDQVLLRDQAADDSTDPLHHQHQRRRRSYRREREAFQGRPDHPRQPGKRRGQRRGLHERRRGQCPRARERPGEDERARRASLVPVRRVADEGLQRQGLPDVSQRRRDSGAARAGGALRRRQRRVFPAR